ncbi:MAG: hypothetical protein ACREGI_04135 [Candidatus Levyibacteriota bacterium]
MSERDDDFHNSPTLDMPIVAQEVEEVVPSSLTVLQYALNTLQILFPSDVNAVLQILSQIIDASGNAEATEAALTLVRAFNVTGIIGRSLTASEQLTREYVQTAGALGGSDSVTVRVPVDDEKYKSMDTTILDLHAKDEDRDATVTMQALTPKEFQVALAHTIREDPTQKVQAIVMDEQIARKLKAVVPFGDSQETGWDIVHARTTRMSNHMQSLASALEAHAQNPLRPMHLLKNAQGQRMIDITRFTAIA